MDWPMWIVLTFVSVDLGANLSVGHNLRKTRRIIEAHNERYHASTPDGISCHVDQR